MLLRRAIPALFLAMALAACAHSGAQTLPYPSAPPAVLLDMLLADYLALDLPLPPPDAPLVRWEEGGYEAYPVPDQKSGPVQMSRRLSYLAFQLPAAPGETEPQFLIGTERLMFQPGHQRARGIITRVEPTAEAAEGVDGIYGLSGFVMTLYPVNAALATAIQAKARGWEGLAERMLDMALKVELSGSTPWRQTSETPLRQVLAIMARIHYVNELIVPGSDWAAIARHLEASEAFGCRIACPMCFSKEKFLDTCAFQDRLLPRLRRTVEHPRAAPGTIEGMIDALCDLSGTWFDSGHGYEPAALRLAELGFDAVPALIEHLEDDRLTRIVEIPFSSFPRFPVLVFNIVSDVLGGIAGPDFLCGPGFCNITPRAARAWWAQAKAKGEEAYMLEHVLPSAQNAKEPNWVVLRIIARKYPRRLEDAYRMALARPQMDTQAIVSAIAASALPVAERRRLLQEGVEHGTETQRAAALRALAKLGP